MLTQAIAAALALALSAPPHVAGPSLNLGGGAPVANASGILDLSKCADGSTTYPCAATEATVKPVGGTVTVSSGASKCGSTFITIGANDLCLPSASGAEIWSAAAHSNALPNTAAVGFNTQVRATASATTGPDGSATSAILLTDDTAETTTHYVSQNYTATAGAWVGSVYLKAGTKTWAFVSFASSGAVAASVNLATCALGTTYGLTSARVTQVGTWCRLESVSTLAAQAYALRLYVANGDGSTAANYTGDGTGTIKAFCPMAQAGTVAGPCVASSGTPVSGSADVASVATTTTDAKGCVGARFYTDQTATARVVGTSVGSAPIILRPGATTVQFYDGTTSTNSGALGNLFGASHTAVACWGGTAANVWVDGTQVITGAPYDGGLLSGGDSKWYPGSAAGTSAHINGAVKKVCQGATYTAVRKCLEAP